jgi:TRAP-type C4-dicarboxylate transport system substrate-binding protein
MRSLCALAALAFAGGVLAIEMGAALACRVMDGIITSPGGWGKNVQDASRASLVPGLLFNTCFLIADKARFDALPAAEQKALAEAARVSVTEKRGEMQAADSRIVAELVARGAAYAVVPADAFAPWRETTDGVARGFAAAHPEVIRRFQAVVGGG